MRYLAASPASRASASGVPLTLATATLFFTLLVGLVVLDELPIVLLASSGLFGGVAFLLYRADKSAVEQGRWRTPESRAMSTPNPVRLALMILDAWRVSQWRGAGSTPMP